MDSREKHNEDKYYMQVLTKAAESMTVCSNEIKDSIEQIKSSCQMPGTIAKAHKSLLLDKSDKLKGIATLYESASKWFMGAVEKLKKGVSQDKVLSDVLAYNTFLNDQVISEQYDLEHISNILVNSNSSLQISVRCPHS